MWKMLLAASVIGLLLVSSASAVIRPNPGPKTYGTYGTSQWVKGFRAQPNPIREYKLNLNHSVR
jgi:hypothetical protein